MRITMPNGETVDVEELLRARRVRADKLRDELGALGLRCWPDPLWEVLGIVTRKDGATLLTKTGLMAGRRQLAVDALTAHSI